MRGLEQVWFVIYGGLTVIVLTSVLRILFSDFTNASYTTLLGMSRRRLEGLDINDKKYPFLDLALSYPSFKTCFRNQCMYIIIQLMIQRSVDMTSNVYPHLALPYTLMHNS